MIDAARSLAEQGRELDALGPVETLDVDTVVERYGPLCKRIVMDTMRQLNVQREHFDEMLADAHLGLIDAHRRYTAKQGSVFSTYAYYRIRGTVVDGLRSAGVLQRRYRLKTAMAEAAARCGETQAEEPNVRTTGQTKIENIDRTISQLGTCWLIIQEMQSAADNKQRQHHPLKRLVDGQTSKMLRRCVDALPDLEREVLVGLYYENQTLQEIGDAHGYSRSWTSRIHTRALRKVQRMFESLS